MGSRVWGTESVKRDADGETHALVVAANWLTDYEIAVDSRLEPNTWGGYNGR